MAAHRIAVWSLAALITIGVAGCSSSTAPDVVDEAPDASSYFFVDCVEGAADTESLVPGHAQTTVDGAVCTGFPPELADFLTTVGPIGMSESVEAGANMFIDPRVANVYTVQVDVADDGQRGDTLFALLPDLGWTELPECYDSYAAGGTTFTTRVYLSSTGAWLEGYFFPFADGAGWHISWASVATGGCG